ncbi:hypothetical protein LTS12_015017 [Elasticomyces elasticus]|nr:hypothetical protein LTS12_015017 [Elasticomyces elasticus]
MLPRYHWVSEYAPPGYQKPLSYAVGWLCALGWQSAIPLISYTAAQQIIALIATCQADFVWQSWQGALLTIAFVVFAILFNMFAINLTPIASRPEWLGKLRFGHAAVHLAEELKDASYILPRAMVSSALMNYATALTTIKSFVSAIDPALLDDVLATSTGGLSNSK